MQKEKAVNLAWVLILFPLVMQIFGAIRSTMDKNISVMIQGIALNVFMLLLLLAIPYAVGKIIK
jgi:hypothetical protein